jgi:hypothetical protein
MLMLPFAPTSWIMAIEIIGLLLLIPAVAYQVGHAILKPYPKLFNALHWIFGIYMAYLMVAGLTTLVMY